MTMSEVNHAAAGSVAIRDTGWYGTSSLLVARFLNCLRCIPAESWLDAAHAELSECRDDVLYNEHADRAAWTRLHDAIDKVPNVARRIRNRIDADISVFDGILPDPAVQRMRRSARLAAYALAVHHALPREDVVRLYRPFRDLIPAPPHVVAD